MMTIACQFFQKENFIGWFFTAVSFICCYYSIDKVLVILSNLTINRVLVTKQNSMLPYTSVPHWTVFSTELPSFGIRTFPSKIKVHNTEWLYKKTIAYMIIESYSLSFFLAENSIQLFLEVTVYLSSEICGEKPMNPWVSVCVITISQSTLKNIYIYLDYTLL